MHGLSGQLEILGKRLKIFIPKREKSKEDAANKTAQVGIISDVRVFRVDWRTKGTIVSS